jgi:hypothetical protein
MITKFKLYENLKLPKMDDYVICESNEWLRMVPLNPDMVFEFHEYIHSHIGKIISEDFHTNSFESEENFRYLLQYDDGILKFLGRRKIWISNKYIKYWSKNKEELEAVLQAKKYNL